MGHDAVCLLPTAGRHPGWLQVKPGQQPTSTDYGSVAMPWKTQNHIFLSQAMCSSIALHMNLFEAFLNHFDNKNGTQRSLTQQHSAEHSMPCAGQAGACPQVRQHKYLGCVLQPNWKAPDPADRSANPLVSCGGGGLCNQHVTDKGDGSCCMALSFK